MELLLAYDVNTSTPQGKRRLRQVARVCEGYGQRVQWSVFEVVCSTADYVKLMSSLAHLIDPEVDSLRCYRLDHGTLGRVVAVGRQSVQDLDESWIM